MPNTGTVQGLAGWGCEQPSLMESDPNHGRVKLELDVLEGPFKPKSFYDF